MMTLTDRPLMPALVWKILHLWFSSCLVLKCQDLENSESGDRNFVTKDLIIFIVIHLTVHVHVHKGFHFSFTHGVICTIVVEDHGALDGTLEGLVASATACEAFEGTYLDGLISWCR